VAPIESLQSPPENMPLVGEIGPKVDGTRMWINTEAHGVEGNRMTQLAGHTIPLTFAFAFR